LNKILLCFCEQFPFWGIRHLQTPRSCLNNKMKVQLALTFHVIWFNCITFCRKECILSQQLPPNLNVMNKIFSFEIISLNWRMFIQDLSIAPMITMGPWTFGSELSWSEPFKHWTPIKNLLNFYN
jgi:hypothetical protein